MTGTTPALKSPEPAAVAPAPDPTLRALNESPYWPVTRLVSWTLTLGLGVGILAPAALARGRSIDWLVLALPAIVATLAARAVFETFGFASGETRASRHVVIALPPALVAVALMSGASAILGDGVSLGASGAAAVLTVITLAGAGAARDVEIRVRTSLRRVYFVGSEGSRRELESELRRHHDASLVGANVPTGPVDRARLIGAVLAARGTVLVLDADAMRVPQLVDVAAELNLAGLRIRDLVSYYEAEFKKVPLSELSPAWFLFDIAPIHRRRMNGALRRGIEVVIAALALAASLPLLALATAAIRLTSPGGALYRQRRVGKGGAEFTLLKLRTMACASSPDAVWAPSEAHRVTSVGRFLRRFRFDEVPQLLNVIRGDLALVGPRPEQVPIAERLDRELPHYSARHCIRPGITGWAQVNLGYAGSVEGTIAKLQRDLYYVKHSSLRLDGLILWLTFKTVIAGRG
jgi:lipopolysaccharide/colanic/teichoic acid biosynthesis glycosyltransferase